MNDQPEIEKQKRRGEKKTVHQIERTADPRQEIPRILHVRAAFDNRFGQITHNRCEPKDRKSTRLNSSHRCISYAVFCLKKKRGQECPRHTKNLAMQATAIQPFAG